MLKSLVMCGRIETSVTKAKELRRHADKLVTLSKKGTLASRRRVIGKLMISHNPLTAKEKREAKNGNTSAYNDDRKVVGKLFSEFPKKYEGRNGGYTRIIKTSFRVGDAAPRCIIEFV